MAIPNVSAGVNRLHHAMKALRDNWELTGASWNDQVRADFERKHLVPLESAVQLALNGMNQLGEVFGRLYRDCTDREEFF